MNQTEYPDTFAAAVDAIVNWHTREADLWQRISERYEDQLCGIDDITILSERADQMACMAAAHLNSAKRIAHEFKPAITANVASHTSLHPVTNTQVVHPHCPTVSYRLSDVQERALQKLDAAKPSRASEIAYETWPGRNFGDPRVAAQEGYKVMKDLSALGLAERIPLFPQPCGITQWGWVKTAPEVNGAPA